MKLFLLAAVAAAVGCTPPDRPLIDASADVAAGVAEQVELKVEMPGGELTLRAAPSPDLPWLRAGFQFDHEAMKPVVIDEEREGGRFLTLRAPGWDRSLGPTTNLWNLAMSDGPAVAVDINMGVGRVQVMKGVPALRSLDIQVNFGEVMVDLSQTTFPASFHGSIEVASGSIVHLIVARDAMVRVRTKNAVGSVQVRGLVDVDGNGETWAPPGLESASTSAEFSIRIGTGDILIEVAE